MRGRGLEAVTDSWKEGEIKYQIVDATRPLNAVSEICDAGGENRQYVLFGKHGGVTYNLEPGSETESKREDGIYCVGFWVKPKNEWGFGRQGR